MSGTYMKSKVCDAHVGEKCPVNRKEKDGGMTKVRIYRGDKVLRKCAATTDAPVLPSK